MPGPETLIAHVFEGSSAQAHALASWDQYNNSNTNYINGTTNVVARKEEDGAEKEKEDVAANRSSSNNNNNNLSRRAVACEAARLLLWRGTEHNDGSFPVLEAMLADPVLQGRSPAMLKHARDLVGAASLLGGRQEPSLVVAQGECNESTSKLGKDEEGACGPYWGVCALLEAMIITELTDPDQGAPSSPGLPTHSQGNAKGGDIGNDEAIGDGDEPSASSSPVPVVGAENIAQMRDSLANRRSTVLRGASPLTKMLTDFVRSPGIGREWLLATVGPTVAKIVRGEVGEMEIAPLGVEGGSDFAKGLVVDQNLDTLLEVTETIFKSICGSVPGTDSPPIDAAELPLGMKRVSWLLHHHFSRFFPEEEEGGATASRNAVQAFIFLRFVVPFIVSPDLLWPELFPAKENAPPAIPSSLEAVRAAGGPSKSALDKGTRRKLILVSKLVQQAVNGREFKPKDQYFVRCNPLLRRYIEPLSTFIDRSMISEDTQGLSNSGQAESSNVIRRNWARDDIPVSPRDALDALNALYANLIEASDSICETLERHGEQLGEVSGGIRALPRSFPNGAQGNPKTLLPVMPLSPKDIEDEALYQDTLREALRTDLSSCRDTGALVVSGVDEEDRPVVVFSIEKLPAKSLDLHQFFLFIVMTLDRIVEHDYVLVYDHTNSNSSHRPSIGFLRKCYAIFNRRYKKNMKKLFIIRPSKWIKLTLRLCRPIVSKKFWQKVTYVEDTRTISQFMRSVSLPAFRTEQGLSASKSDSH